jgi:hypothetical protein
VVAHDDGGFARVELRGIFRRRHAQHGARLEQVDVAAHEGIGIGAQQREHRLVERIAATRHLARDFGQRLALLHADAIGRRGDEGVGGRGDGVRASAWGPRRRRSRARVRRRLGGRLRCGVFARRGRGFRFRRRRGGHRALDHVGRRHRRRFDRRLRGRGHGARRVEQRRVFADQAAAAPVDFDQEGHQRLVHRRAAGDADDGTAAFIERDAEVQVGGGARGRIQADAAEGVRRGQPRLQLLQLRGIARNDRDLGQQGLVDLRFDLDLAKASAAAGPATAMSASARATRSRFIRRSMPVTPLRLQRTLAPARSGAMRKTT